LENEGISRDIVTGFLVYLMCHRRPPHELLKPTLKDQSKLFNSDFEGMTNTVFKYKNFLETRDILINKINTNLNSEDKIFLISFFEGNPTWSLFRHPSAQNLPAIKWKLENLNKNGLETKRNAQLELLRSIF
jgi:hypothetical protein